MSNLLFDRKLLDVRLSRIAGHLADHDFLLKRVATSYGERLSSILREFPFTIDLGALHGPIGELCRKHPRIQTIVQLESNLKLLNKCSGLKVRSDIEALPLRNESVDLVLSALVLSFVNDLPGVLVQIRRALKPDGLFLGTVFGTRTLDELRQSFYQAEEETVGGISPHTIPMIDVRDCGTLLQRAGFALPVADSDLVTVKYSTPWSLFEDLRGMGMTNILRERHKSPLKRKTIFRMIELYEELFSDQEGKVEATFELITLTGWSPHASQPKPLQPGSASRRLADALDTREISGGEKASPSKSD